jgi:hypothetical protein
MAFVIHHVYSAILVSKEEHNGLMESIFTGWKFVSRRLLKEDEAGAVELHRKEPKGSSRKQGSRQ